MILCCSEMVFRMPVLTPSLTPGPSWGNQSEPAGGCLRGLVAPCLVTHVSQVMGGGPHTHRLPCLGMSPHRTSLF